MILVPALLIGVIAGLRTMTALAAVSWGAWAGAIPLADTWLALLGSAWAPLVLSVLALGEFVTDQLPSTPSRTVPVQFAARVIVGALCGAALTIASAGAVLGAALGAAGAVAGTLGGAAARAALAARFGRDRPAALLEDLVAVAGAALVISAV